MEKPLLGILGTRTKVILEQEDRPSLFLSPNEGTFADRSLWPFLPNPGRAPPLPKARTQPFPLSTR